MTLSPLHLAFVWILKPWFRTLSFAALTVGAMVPDLESLIAWIFGASVFCGWDFPCTLAPDRLVLHSIVGALTVDVALSALFVLLLGLLKLERLGINGFSNVKINSFSFLLSAAIGSLTHVFIDWLHHPANPIFWPFLVGGSTSYYVDGLLLQITSVLHASLILAIVSAAIMAAIMARAIHKSGCSFSAAFSNPKMAASIITQYLSKER